MSDERLRELERRWKETNLVEDEAASLDESLRINRRSERDLSLAAIFGSVASSMVLDYRTSSRCETISDRASYKEWYESAIFLISVSEPLVAVCLANYYTSLLLPYLSAVLSEEFELFAELRQWVEADLNDLSRGIDQQGGCDLILRISRMDENTYQLTSIDILSGVELRIISNAWMAIIESIRLSVLENVGQMQSDDVMGLLRRVVPQSTFSLVDMINGQHAERSIRKGEEDNVSPFLMRWIAEQVSQHIVRCVLGYPAPVWNQVV